MYNYKVYKNSKVVVDSKSYDEFKGYFEDNGLEGIKINEEDNFNSDYEDVINEVDDLFYEDEDIRIMSGEFYDFNSNNCFKIIIRIIKEK